LITVDVHTHFIPPDLVRDARAGRGFGGVTVEGGQMVHPQGYRYPLDVAFYDVGARLAAMDERKIDHAITSIAPTMYMYWEKDATAYCRDTNDALAAHAAASGGRITAVAALPMQDPEAAAAELERAVTRLGMRGAQIGPETEGRPLDLPEYRPVLERAQHLGVPLILHPYYVGSRLGLDDFYLTNLAGNPLATAICAARLIFSGTLDDLPSLRLVLMHGGGYLPYQIGRLDHGHRVRPEAAGCKLMPSAYLSRFCYDTITHAPAPLRFLVDLVGQDNVLYGTDFPFDMAAGPLADQLAGADLPGGAIEPIAGLNAVREFGLGIGGGVANDR
jgi:aminocarboxymuconate-semialdehyde decarboxylase